jgi:hypothetical protein
MRGGARLVSATMNAILGKLTMLSSCEKYMNISCLVALSLLLGIEAAASAQELACTQVQLEIRQIAGDAPGMSKSNAFFAIVNKESTPCRLSAQLVEISEVSPTDHFHDNTQVDFILPPLDENGFARAKDVIGFNVSNDGASGPARNIKWLYFRLANGETFYAKYSGYDTSPFSPRAQIIPFFAWRVFEGDQCMTTENKPLSFTDESKIDTHRSLSCG